MDDAVMPIYEYQCENGHRREIYTSIRSTHGAQGCSRCGLLMDRIISAPLLVKVSQDVRYDSPIDGTHITNHYARLEDMKRHNCREYDPEEKTDFHRRQQQRDDDLDAAIDASVEEAIEKMPTKQRGQLASELTEQGVGVEYVRRSA